MERFPFPGPHAAKRFASDRRGSGAIEFAILAPVFLLLLFGTVRVGYAIGVQHALAQLAASAARYAVPASTQDRRETLARAYIDEHAASFVLLDGERVDLRIEQSLESLAVEVSMDVSHIPHIPIVESAFRFPDLQTASAVIAVQN